MLGRHLALFVLSLVASTASLGADVAVSVPASGLFHSAKSTFQDQESARLDQLLAALQADPSLVAIVGVHSDSQGSSAYNLTLSQRRADAVKEYLVSRGIAADRLTATGFGEAEPIAPNTTADGRSTNRRVELRTTGTSPEVTSQPPSPTNATPDPSPPERADPSFPHTPTWLDYAHYRGGDFSSKYMEKGPEGYEITLKFVVPTAMTATLDLGLRGPKSELIRPELQLQGGTWQPTPLEQTQRWPAGTHAIRFASKSRKATYSLGVTGQITSSAPPTHTSDICTVLDYLAYQVSTDMSGIQRPKSGFGPKFVSVAGLDVRFKGNKDLQIDLFAGDEADEAEAAETHQIVANLAAGCLGERVSSEAIDWEFYDTYGGLLKTHMGIPSGAYVNKRIVRLVAHRSNFMVDVAEEQWVPSPSAREDGATSTRKVHLRVYNAPLIYRLD